MQQPLTVAFVSDRGLFLPTLRAAHSALLNSSTPLRVLFVGAGLDDHMWRMVETLQRQHPAATVEASELPADWLRDATSPKDFITPTALGRMFLPRLAGGRILYIDGDTLITGDLSAAAAIDLQGRPLAGVRDYAVMSWLASGKTASLARQSDALGGRNDLSGYINSGVLLMDSDAIRATPGLEDQMQDMIAAQGYPTVDQDRINVIFEDRITHLDPAWNCSWGRLRQQRQFETGLPSTAPMPRPVILHFHGPKKPWHQLRLSSLSKGALSVWAYRRAMRAFERSFPEQAG